MPHPTAYLTFDGNCKEAMRFYEKALDGTLVKLMTIADAPMAEPCPGADPERIMHACLQLPDGGELMAGDCPTQMPYQGMHGFGLTLSYDTVAAAERVFQALAEGGTVTMPMQPAFWARRWGMLTDRFGTHWIVNGELLPI